MENNINISGYMKSVFIFVQCGWVLQLTCRLQALNTQNNNNSNKVKFTQMFLKILIYNT